MIVILLGACQNEQESIEDIEVPEKSEGFFWEGEHNDKEVYILGTIHAGKREMYPLRDEIEEVIANTDYLLKEIHITDSDVREELSQFERENMYLEDNEKLEDHLNEEELERVREIVEANNNLKFETANTFQPHMIYGLFEQFIANETDYSFNQGVEEYLYENIPEETEIGSLEDPIERKEILYNPDIEGQFYDLKQALSVPFEETINELNHAIDGWRAGEEEARDFSREVDEDAENAEFEEDYFNRWLILRDENIADSIEDAIENHDADTILIAAGTAHFFGRENVIDLLAERGYDFERK
ncbi:TraB/GumN family protein [Halalkalibacillus halophilus]|uniref:TraB/GumN family protein n=1 Tax=Halalkalibacillus halophilus TaxID=392827 RepID=UPI00146F8F06|nr:TraB/GumN family protein [Halalkalibacillus halophilus]